MNKRLFGFLSVISLILCIASCSGSGGSANIEEVESIGELSVGLTDATTNDYQAVYVTVAGVSVRQEAAGDTWIVVSEPNVTVNLLELVNGVIEPLGLGELETGSYSQMRLLLGNEPDEGVNILDESHPYANYIIFGDDTEYFELTVPSGFQSGIKINKVFTIVEDEEKHVVLDFDVMDSVVMAGNSGEWFLKPTIKAIEPESSVEVTGVIYDNSATGTDTIEGAIISAQTAMGNINSEAVSAATISDENGGYSLLLEPAVYTIVAIKEGYQSSSADVTFAENEAVTQDFYLDSVEGIGTIYGNVEIQNGLDEQSVTIQIFNDDGDRVTTMSVANGGTYWFDLAPGLYSMLAIFTVGGEEMEMEAKDSFEIEDGTIIEFDILFRNQENGGGTERVTICHKGRTIAIPESALQAHLDHGDAEGACVEGEETEEEDGEPAGGEDTVDTIICHKGRTITVSESALDAHLAHGDTIGACIEVEVDEDGITPI